MEHLGPQEVTVMFLALGTLLASAKIFGELARRLSLRSVFGEIFAGILLGPTVLGTVFPDVHQCLFPSRGSSAQVGEGVTTLTIALAKSAGEKNRSSLRRLSGRRVHSAQSAQPVVVGGGVHVVEGAGIGDRDRFNLLRIAL